MGMTNAYAYVDGSWIKGAKETTGAMIFLIGNKVVSAMCFKTEDQRMVRHQQISGEVISALYVLEFVDSCLSDSDHSLSELHIAHDYIGTANWVTGIWKNANTELSRQYKQRALKAVKSLNQKGVKVIFDKVDAHSGDYYNEMADKLTRGVVHPDILDMYDGVVEYEFGSDGLIKWELKKE